jgi:hypothetical protein
VIYVFSTGSETISRDLKILGTLRGVQTVIFTLETGATHPSVGYRHRVSTSIPFVETSSLFEQYNIYECSFYTKSNKYLVVQKELLTSTKSFAKVYQMGSGSAPPVINSSTKGIPSGEWDKVFQIKYAKTFNDELYFFLVENGGAIQIQTMFFHRISPFELRPMDIIQSSVFSSSMSYGYDHLTKTFMTSEGTKVHIFVD